MDVGISRRSGLVLKVFHTQRMFESELKAYLVLQEAGVKFIPQLLGVFNVPGTKGTLLLTMVGKDTQEPYIFLTEQVSPEFSLSWMHFI